MEIDNVETRPYERSIFPGIAFGVEISYTKCQEAIVAVTGWLEADDGKIVAEVREARRAGVPPSPLFYPLLSRNFAYPGGY